MHDVDVRLILIVHFIQNHLVFIRKLIYFKIHGIVRLESYRIVRMFDYAQKKHRILSKRFEWMMFPMKSSANESYGKIPMVYNPTNQTTKIGKIPNDQNPPKFL